MSSIPSSSGCSNTWRWQPVLPMILWGLFIAGVGCTPRGEEGGKCLQDGTCNNSSLVCALGTCRLLESRPSAPLIPLSEGQRQEQRQELQKSIEQHRAKRVAARNKAIEEHRRQAAAAERRYQEQQVSLKGALATLTERLLSAKDHAAQEEISRRIESTKARATQLSAARAKARAVDLRQLELLQAADECLADDPLCDLCYHAHLHAGGLSIGGQGMSDERNA